MNKNQFELLVKLYPIHKEPLIFVQNIIKLSEQTTPDDLSLLVNTNRKETEPLINPANFTKIPLTNSLELFLKLINFVIKQNSALEQAFAGFIKQWKNNNGELRNFFLDVLLGNPKNKCIAQNEIMVFLIKSSLRPSLKTLLGKTKNKNGFCPVCGFPPKLAVMETTCKPGKITMLCSFCAEKWNFQETKCPYCLTKDKLIKIEAGKNCYLSGCEKCRGYIRVIKNDDLEEITDDRFLDIISDPANILAEDLGFKA